jgi:hypothetical protein
MVIYVKKPVIVHAFQLTRDNKTDIRSWPDWLQDAWKKEKYSSGSFWYDKDDWGFMIETHTEGAYRLKDGDYIVQNERGELYPYSADIFEMTYEPAGSKL